MCKSNKKIENREKRAKRDGKGRKSRKVKSAPVEDEE